MKQKTVALVDYGVGNRQSLVQAFERLGARIRLTRSGQEIREADAVVLPGVGAAQRAREMLNATGLDDCLRRLESPVLGICLGAQLLAESSAEGQCKVSGLGLLQGEVRRLDSLTDRPGETDQTALRLPHMGWAETRWDEPYALFEGIPSGEAFYYAHSYALPVQLSTVARTFHGVEYSAAVQHLNFVGFQFHPEKSGAAGMRLLQNFLNLRIQSR